jgi:hypothetical protein
MIQPQVITWHRYNPRNGDREGYHVLISPLTAYRDPKFFKRNGEQRTSVRISGKTYYRG